MNITGVIIAAAVVGATGILIGVLLGVASEKFKVEVDEREILVREALPGNNCGGYLVCPYKIIDNIISFLISRNLLAIISISELYKSKVQTYNNS